VLLETEWALRSVYAFTMAQVSKALRDFAGLPRVTIEDEGAAAKALDWMDAGIDFADALHLTKAGACDAFITFDERLARAANRLGTVKVRAP
jgi:predicted nucleic acid-binding protein